MLHEQHIQEIVSPHYSTLMLCLGEEFAIYIENLKR